MKAALVILAAMVLTGLVLWLYERRWQRRNAAAEQPEPEAGASGECCGMHITCEKDSLLAAVSEKIEYYDDEELDRYAGKDAESYSEEETEQFRDILLTMRPDDIAGWARSLQLRGIALPTEVREELLMIVAEARDARKKAHV